jgi:hypothetical protein
MQRRSLLKLGVGSAVLLAAAGGLVAMLQPGLRQGRLASAGREVFSSVGRAILTGTLPADQGAAKVAINGLLDRIDGLTANLPPHAQVELSQLLGLLATAAGRRGVAGLSSSWADAPVTEVQQALQGMRLSSVSLRQQAYQALHDIAGGAYFADASTWPALGYPGPTKI